MELVAAVLLFGVFGAVLAHQLSGRGPAVWLLFVVGGLAYVALGVLPPSRAAAALAGELPVFLFLFSLFVFTVALERSGALEHLAQWILGRATRPAEVPFALFVGFGALSAFLLNDALVLLGVPLLIGVSRRLGTPAQPLLLTLAFSVTVGSALTPLGNPQNLLVSLASGIHAPLTTFLRYLLLPTAINLVLGGLYVGYRFGGRLAAATGGGTPRLPFLPPGPWGPRLRRSPVLAVFPATIVVLLTTDLAAAVTGAAGVPLYAVTLVGALLVLALSPERAPVVRGVDGSILALFAGLFVVVAGASYGGVVSALEAFLPVPAPGHPAAGIGSTLVGALVGSQLFSNVPWVTLQIPLLQGLGYSARTPVIWIALAGGSTLAGNVTLLGAASNLIVVQQAERRGERLSLREFVRYGAPLAAMTVVVLYVCLLVGL